MAAINVYDSSGSTPLQPLVSQFLDFKVLSTAFMVSPQHNLLMESPQHNLHKIFLATDMILHVLYFFSSYLASPRAMSI